MPIRLTNIRTLIDRDENDAIDKAIKRLGVLRSQVNDAYVSKKSLDARQKHQMMFVYTVVVCLKSDEQALVKKLAHPFIQWMQEEDLHFYFGTKKLSHRIVIAGFGPAGIFAAYALAKNGYRPFVIERGGDLDSRINAVDDFLRNGNFHTENNIQFGEGGAGTFSDGKLTTRISDPFCRQVINIFLENGAPCEIAKMAKPHIGTDKLREVIHSIREEILSMGGEIHFHTCLDGVSIRNGALQAVSFNGEWHAASILLLALGHSARDTFSMLFRAGIKMVAKPFSVGARIEHRQEDINRALYGDYADNPLLPIGEYQLSYRENNRGVYTFCMCPGGFVVPANSTADAVVTNGMSEYKRDGKNANSALVVNVDPSDFGTHPFDGIRFQEMIERNAFALAGKNYTAPAATIGCFLDGKTGICMNRTEPTYPFGVCAVDFHKIFPTFVVDMMKKGLCQFEKKLPGFSCRDAVLTAPETRTSSPIRMLRTDAYHAEGLETIYPCGEGAGYAGGIMSAAVDGLRVAQQIMKIYAPMN